MLFDNVPVGRHFKFGDRIFQKLDIASATTNDGYLMPDISTKPEVWLLPTVKSSIIEEININDILLRHWHKPGIRRDAGKLFAHIKAHGILNPLTITVDGYLIDGWWRYQACVEHNINYVPVHRLTTPR